jgi:hypothetical protein
MSAVKSLTAGMSFSFPACDTANAVCRPGPHQRSRTPRMRELEASPCDDDKIDGIMLAVGHALRNWSRMEGVLTSILWRCMGNRTPAPEAPTWGHVINLAPKLKIVEQVLSLVVSDAAAMGLWGKISATVNAKNRLRNDLAHYRVVRFDDEPRLVSNHRSADRGKPGCADANEGHVRAPIMELDEAIAYAAADIWQISDNFDELGRTITWYRDWVVEFNGIPHELDVESPRLIIEFLSTLPPSHRVSKTAPPSPTGSRLDLSGVGIPNISFYRFFDRGEKFRRKLLPSILP